MKKKLVVNKGLFLGCNYRAHLRLFFRDTKIYRTRPGKKIKTHKSEGGLSIVDIRHLHIISRDGSCDSASCSTRLQKGTRHLSEGREDDFSVGDVCLLVVTHPGKLTWLVHLKTSLTCEKGNENLPYNLQPSFYFGGFKM